VFSFVSGKNWPILRAAIETKTLDQIKNFYYDYKKKLSKETAELRQEKAETTLIPVESIQATVSTNSIPQSATDSGRPTSTSSGNGEAFMGNSGFGGLPNYMLSQNLGNQEFHARGSHPGHQNMMANFANVTPWMAAQLLQQQSQTQRMGMRDAWEGK